MKELELKHLAGYLPYGLKYYTKSRINNKNGFAKLNASCINHVLNNKFKPILRPLSDLTKEIEVNGEKFVPLSCLEEKFRPASRDLSIYLLNSIICIDIETKDYSQKIDLYDGFLIIQKLLEWHFDIYGLIKNGLAIDINTL